MLLDPVCLWCGRASSTWIWRRDKEARGWKWFPGAEWGTTAALVAARPREGGRLLGAAGLDPAGSVAGDAGGGGKAVGAGAHPRTPFYGEFLRAAKAVWLLHLLAFALEPPPSHFEAGRGAEFHPEYMESVAGPAPRGAGMVVGFAVAPGFKLCNAAVVRARVYLVPRGGSRQ